MPEHSFWNRMISRWKELRRQSAVTSRRIQWGAEGVRLLTLSKDQSELVEWSTLWSEVQRVVAFKMDQYTYDCLCLGLEDASGSWHFMDEEMSGWDGFLDAMPVNLPGAAPRASVYEQVALPAFKENRTVLFER